MPERQATQALWRRRSADELMCVIKTYTIYVRVSARVLNTHSRVPCAPAYEIIIMLGRVLNAQALLSMNSKSTHRTHMLRAPRTDGFACD